MIGVQNLYFPLKSNNKGVGQTMSRSFYFLSVILILKICFIKNSMICYRKGEQYGRKSR